MRIKNIILPKIDIEILEESSFELNGKHTCRVISRYKVAYGWIVETMVRSSEQAATISSVFVSDPDHSQFKLKGS